MGKNFLFTLIFGLFAACSTVSDSANIFDIGKVKDGPVVVTVNGLKVHQGFLDLLSTLNPRVASQLANPLTRKKLVDSLVEQQLLYQEAVKRGLHKSEDVIVKSLLNKNVIVSNTLIEHELEEAMKKTYEEKKAEQFTRVKVSLIAKYFKPESDKPAKEGNEKPTEKEEQVALEKIKKIKGRLSKGEDFAKLATDESDDKVTKKKGGDAGPISRDDKRFKRLGLEGLITAAFALKKGQVSEPIKTEMGYYVVTVTSDPIISPFEDAKRILGFEMQNKVKQDLVDSLKKNAVIEYAMELKDMDEKKLEEKAQEKSEQKVEEKVEQKTEETDTAKEPS